MTAERKTLWEIGERVDQRQASRKDAAVVRPAVYQLGKYPMVITSEPCCYGTRRIEARYFENGPWPEKCNKCKWHYQVALVTTGPLELGGLVGVKWISSGFGDKR